MIRRWLPAGGPTALGIVAILGAGCGDEGRPAVPTVPSVPVAPLPVAEWVEATSGEMPLVIVVPHGGELAPSELPDRACGGCVTANDANTQALARAISDAFVSRVGRRPFLVVNRLHRRKFDGNRALPEATAAHDPLEPMWHRLHDAIDTAKARAQRVHPRVLVIDLHGHGHAIQRLELGYLLSASALRLGDAALTPLVPASSIAGLTRQAVSGDAGAALVRGPRSLGARFAAAGVPAVPSDVTPAPQVGEAYFDGGYNTARHGSAVAGPADAIQVELHYAGLRDTAINRARFAESFVTAVLAFLRDHYGWEAA